ncbi:Beta-ribofuranosylaminobenzene 5'-phosphate synthase [Candidatus Lokiarchaeum ossiferum]|uniref:Beta-ribofuranosylaminobenzene 5'-phosphate synthase n=1 Tax=Candidatus Lokiarchaeum ossiferum TaxID=2951803 RepID=A0ABY6HZE7_9ARCH|nr:Beta-ribofuranosylaminobenzene 5'-phosphate synthase [Candidatus Lokiarchaeum sp. B-35]
MKFQISTPARIHLSLIDLNGSLDRVDGGLGICVNNPQLKIEFSDETSDLFVFSGPQQHKNYFEEFAIKFYEKFNIVPKPIAVKIQKFVAEHQGLGSKTQFLLTIAKGMCMLYETEMTPHQMAVLIGRGGTSGIGYQTFFNGGFVFDLGHSFGKGKDKQSFLPSSASASPPALPFYLNKCPTNWRILLIQLNVKQGANKEEEINIFQKYTPLKLSDVEKISHRILMQFLPGFIENNISLMAQSLHFINNHGFKKVEISLQNSLVSILIEKIYQKFSVPVGMSSFGPTIFTICDSNSLMISIKSYVQNVLENELNSPECAFIETKPNNKGHKIEFL